MAHASNRAADSVTVDGISSPSPTTPTTTPGEHGRISCALDALWGDEARVVTAAACSAYESCRPLHSSAGQAGVQCLRGVWVIISPCMLGV